MRVLIVPDKFKGTLDAHRVARAVARGWHAARPRDSLELLPMSDGGDGFGPVIGGLLRARIRTVTTTNAAGQTVRARWWWSATRRTAILETARSNGLALLPAGTHHPFDLDTTGVARLVQAALRAGATSCLLGVGGSATNDGGFGLARALGWQFLDLQDSAILRWIDLPRLARIVPPTPPASRCRFIVATDVSNPLLGRHGASTIYGPQKGLTPDNLPVAELALRRLAQVVRQQTGFDSRAPGSGAAGGLGFGLQAFLGAERCLGFNLFADLSRLEHRITRSDLVITGEGAIDRSSLMGKGVGQLLDLCARLGRPVLVVGGRVSLGRSRHPAILAARGLVEIADESTALRKPAQLLTRLTRELATTVTPLPQRPPSPSRPSPLPPPRHP